MNTTMLKCGICLISNKDWKMVLFNDQYVSYFNLLTSLNIKTSDMSWQHLCESCIDMLNSFMKFRDKCIIASCFMQSNFKLIEDVKLELIQENDRENNKIQEDYTVNINIVDKHVKIEAHEDNSSAYEDIFVKDDVDFDVIISNNICKNKEIIKPNCNKVEKAYTKKHRQKKILTVSLPCGLCPETFEDKSSMSNHMDSHKNDTVCLLCSQGFNDWQQLFSHRLNHVSKKDKTCHICAKKFITSSSLEYHYKKNHSDNENILLRCLLCNKSSKTPRLLRKHIWRCHSDKKFICDYCLKEFKTKQQIKTHIVVHMECKPFVCDLCEYSCKFTSNLSAHKINKHSTERVHCTKCHRVFRNQLLLDKHKCPDKTLVCATCGKTFPGNQQLRRHMRTHEAGRHRCERCPAALRTRAALRAHRERHDGVRSKRCEYCPKSFYSTCVLIKHRRTHTGIKPYVCRICEKAFTGNNNLKMHMRVHGEYLIKKKVSPI